MNRHHGNAAVLMLMTIVMLTPSTSDGTAGDLSNLAGSISAFISFWWGFVELIKANRRA